MTAIIPRGRDLTAGSRLSTGVERWSPIGAREGSGSRPAESAILQEKPVMTTRFGEGLEDRPGGFGPRRGGSWGPRTGRAAVADGSRHAGAVARPSRRAKRIAGPFAG